MAVERAMDRQWSAMEVGAEPVTGSRRATRWVLGFLLVQAACRLALLSTELGQFRAVIRAVVFGSSLVALVWVAGVPRRHPAKKAAYAIFLILVLELFHPLTNGVLSGTAQLMMYVAILAPLFWASRLRGDTRLVRRALLLIWAFQALSAIFGVLQVYFPGHFSPPVSTVIQEQGSGYLEALRITLANGESIFRPMGLTDVPGGAAMAGFYTVLIGMGILLGWRKPRVRLLALPALFIGMFVLYLSQVRSVLVMLGITLVVMSAVLSTRLRLGRVLVLGTLVSIVALGSLYWALDRGGEEVSNRLSTLVATTPGQVYQKNRGHFLEHTVEDLLPRYPLGAGLGRWGMMYAYFGNHNDPHRGEIWAEIQWTGWLLDGGVPLILAYVVAIFLAIWSAWRVWKAPGPASEELRIWAVVILAYDVGALALTFNYAFFNSENGMELWLLNALLFAAANPPRPRRRRLVPQ